MANLQEVTPLRKSYYTLVQKYKEHFSFLKNSKFLQDLENDSVDSDIIEEELSALQEVPISTREKVAKFLQSNPVQILLCIIVLLDAGIVIAQILLDLNSVKDKLHRRDLQLSSLLKYIKETQTAKLHGYTGEDVDLILRMLREEPSREEGLNRTTSNLTTIQQNRNEQSVNWINRTQAKEGSGSAAESTTDREGYTSTHMMVDFFQHVEEGEHDLLHEVAHGLHFASIALLGFLVIEDFIKIIAMGRTFFKHKIEIFDAVIIVSSFAIDIVFLGGVSGEEGQKAAAVLVILLLWRIARVVDGIVVTVKQRQEFRIRLQKRARRIAEKKLESFEEERHSKTRQIEALKDLCTKAGITDADIAACAPADAKRVNTTLCALSSVARLSVSMTMLMSSGVYRPRLLDDRLVLPKMFTPRPKEPSTTQKRGGVLPRIESLPIMKNSYMSGSASKKQQRRHRKSASGKIYRKNDEEVAGGGRRGGGAGSINLPSSSTIETTEDCSHVTIESTTSSGASAPEMDRGRLMESPVNSCGVHIVIDRGSDAEADIFPVRESADEGSSSPPNSLGPRLNSTDTSSDHNVGSGQSTGTDNGTGPTNGATPGPSRDFSEPGSGIESEVGSGRDTMASMVPITSPEPEGSHDSTLGSEPSCQFAPNHAEAQESSISPSPDQGTCPNFDSTPWPCPDPNNVPTPGPNKSIIAGIINSPIPEPSKGPTSGPSNALTQGPSKGPTFGSSPGSVVDPGLSPEPGLRVSSDHGHRELMMSDSPSNSQSILLSDI